MLVGHDKNMILRQVIGVFFEETANQGSRSHPSGRSMFRGFSKADGHHAIE
jgi:hypothetical protein